jgi:general stress protein YciG
VLEEVVEKPKQRRGFACMTPERRREIAMRGGASVKPESRAFSKNRELAIEAGRKGGMKSRKGPKQEPAAEAAEEGQD